MTSVRSPFGDSFEVDGVNFDFVFGNRNAKENGSGSGAMGGIKVYKTVEISRLESDEEGEGSLGSASGSRGQTPWQRPGTGRSERDIV